MSTLRTMVITSTTMALILSATVAFAQERPRVVGDRVNDSRPLATSTTDRVKVTREKAMNRLADIQDKVKSEMAIRLADRLGTLNATWTSRFTDTLNRYDTIVGKIQSRADKAQSAGKDVSTTTAAILSAKTAIASARTAVTLQAAKTYELDTSTVVTTSATSTSSGQGELMKGLRKSFQTLNTTLFKDLFALRDGPMKNTRKAVQDAHQTLGKIPGVDEDNATSTKKLNQ